MERGVALVHDGTNLGHVFSVCVVRSAFAARAGELVEHHAATQVGGVLRFEGARIAGVEARRHVARKHGGIREAAAQRQIACLASKIHEFGDGVLEEHRRHARSAHAADFFLIDQNADARFLKVARLKLRDQAGEGAYAIVVAVAEYHGAVEAQLACAAGGNDLELARKEVLFFHAVFLGKQREHGRFHGFFFRELLEFGFLGVFLIFRLRGRAATCEHVEIFALDNLGGLLLHLVVGEVNEQVSDAEHGVACVFAHVHALNAAVFFRDNAMNGERQCDPLVLLDAAVVMRVEQREIARFVERVLLDIQTRAVDVRAQNV